MNRLRMFPTTKTLELYGTNSQHALFLKSKLAHLSELESTLCNNEKPNEEILPFFSAFRIGRFLDSFNSFKSKEVDVSVLSLPIFRLRNKSIYRMQVQCRNFLESIDDNTFFSLMNNEWMDWHKLLMGFTKQFVYQVKAKGDSLSGTTCFVLDDTDIEKCSCLDSGMKRP